MGRNDLGVDLNGRLTLLWGFFTLGRLSLLFRLVLFHFLLKTCGESIFCLELLVILRDFNGIVWWIQTDNFCIGLWTTKASSWKSELWYLIESQSWRTAYLLMVLQIKRISVDYDVKHRNVSSWVLFSEKVIMGLNPWCVTPSSSSNIHLFNSRRWIRRLYLHPCKLPNPPHVLFVLRFQSLIHIVFDHVQKFIRVYSENDLVFNV